MIRFGIVGYGRIGQRHARAIETAEGGVLVAVADPNVQSLPGEVRHYDTVEQMMARETLDVVCICSPNGTHARQSMLALESGAHVICEKPMALNSKDALQMLNAARANDRRLVCVLQNRYSAQVQWLKEMVEKGKLGSILQVQVNCFWNRDDRYYLTSDGKAHAWHGDADLDGGPLFTQFSHFVDLLIWLLDDITIGNTTFRNFTHQDSIAFEDAGMFDFHFGDNGFGCFHYSTAVWDRNQESSITLVGSKGSIRLGGQYMDHLEYCHFEGDDGDVQFPEKKAVPPPGNHLLVIQNMIDAVGKGARLHFDIRDALKGVVAMEEVYKSRKL